MWTAVYLGVGRERAVERLDSLMAGPGFAALEVTSRPYDDIAYLYGMGGRADRGAEVFNDGERALEQTGSAGASLLRQRWHRMMSDALQAAILMQKGRSPEAVAAFRQARTAFPYTNWLPEIGTAQDRAGATDSALAVYQEYLGSNFNFRLFDDPYNLAPVLRRTGELYEARGDRTRAAATYQRFVDLWRNADPELQPQVDRGEAQARRADGRAAVVRKEATHVPSSVPLPGQRRTPPSGGGRRPHSGHVVSVVPGGPGNPGGSVMPAEPAVAQALSDRYRIEREIGHGGMATVYLAEDLRHHRKVALKVLRPELAAVIGAERFLAEIRTTANLQHPHILPLHDSGKSRASRSRSSTT